nr:MAG TPA: hypothetical protein [Caudoviricetes sp.]
MELTKMAADSSVMPNVNANLAAAASLSSFVDA